MGRCARTVQANAMTVRGSSFFFAAAGVVLRLWLLTASVPYRREIRGFGAEWAVFVSTFFFIKMDQITARVIFRLRFYYLKIIEVACSMSARRLLEREPIFPEFSQLNIQKICVIKGKKMFKINRLD